MAQTTLTPPVSRQLPGVDNGAPSRGGVGPALRRAAGKLRSRLPAAILLAAFAAIAYLGHRADWKISKFSALVGQEEKQHSDWCDEHGVPESQCIECNHKLVPPLKDFGFCKEHGVSQCPLHHPEVAQLKNPPVISAATFEQAGRALALRPRRENNARCEMHNRRIQFASPEAVKKAGVDIAVATEQPLVEAISANAEVRYDETRTAHLSSRVPGTIWRVEKQVGDSVKKGELLALVDAADVGRSKGELVQAITQLRLKKETIDRLKPLAGGGGVAMRQVREAESDFQEAQVRLLSAEQTLLNLGLPVNQSEFVDLEPEEISRQVQFLGLPREVVSELKGRSATSNLFPLRSPFDGTVIERNVVAGEVVDTTKNLLSVADVRRMWLVLDVQQEDVEYVSIGLPVVFHRGAESRGRQERDEGKVMWLSTSADEETRTVKVRAEVPNDHGQLRSGTFGSADVVLRQEEKALFVPAEAVHWDGCCNVVFVRDKNYFEETAPKFFHIRKVRPGVKAGDNVEIIAGLLPGEVVASKGSDVLRSQLLKNNLGEGCTCGQ